MIIANVFDGHGTNCAGPKWPRDSPQWQSSPPLFLFGLSVCLSFCAADRASLLVGSVQLVKRERQIESGSQL